MRVNDQQITFNVFNAMKCANTDKECHAIEIVDTIISIKFNHIVPYMSPRGPNHTLESCRD
ncbi:hypothetical protein EPI10_032034 [Gossypium australe]|uniref:Uncharacterized protein n=1 Tax=Gossypium australe TaxID=47621 RepID=A0A5B6X5I7_9ROSI|nr:hypothetical protein EPI10_032034 [Gossypium australe]